MSVVSYLSRSDVFLVVSSTSIIILAFVITIVITTAVQGEPEKSFSKVLTVGPVWRTNTWLCSSTEEFMVHGVLIAYADNVGLTIALSGLGTQPDFRFALADMKTFSIGGPADSSITFTRAVGVITGFLTLQTSSGATASCEPL